MSSHAERIEIDLQCVRCRRRITWAWLITYKSYRYTQLVYVCSECGSVIKVSKAVREEGSYVLPLSAGAGAQDASQTWVRSRRHGSEL